MESILNQLSNAEKEIEQRLEALPTQYRTAFAAACCERFLQSYLAFTIVHQWGDITILERVLAQVWWHLKGGDLSETDLPSYIRSLEEVTPDVDVFRSVYTWPAINAVTAIVNTIEHIISGDPKHAINLINLSITNIDTYVRDVALPYTRIFISQEETKIFDDWVWGSPLMTEALDNHRMDLRDLEDQTLLTVPFLDDLRDRAKKSGISLVERGLAVARET